jgi:hypothetical protein
MAGSESIRGEVSVLYTLCEGTHEKHKPEKKQKQVLMFEVATPNRTVVILSLYD